MSDSAPVQGPVLTRPFRVLVALAAIAGGLLLWRFVFGLGSVTALNDGFPWGLWIAWDVVVGTALATGGYGVALMVYVANRGKYHPLVRSALVTSALGYTLAGVSVVIDLGRWWNVPKLPFSFWAWNLESVLLEVALCIMLYMVVLWIELGPAILEKMKESRSDFAREFSAYFTPRLARALPFIIALGILLPTMHQSSLGSLLLIAGEKVHPLWQTPLLPLLFLISCLPMGYGAVIMESQLSSRAFGRPSEIKLLRGLSRPMSALLVAYLVIRLGDLAFRGQLAALGALDGYTALFALELAIFATAAYVLFFGTLHAPLLFRAAMLVLIGGAVYRFSAFLFAFRPGPGFSYFPAVSELMITIGIISAEIALYLLIVKKLPILAALPKARIRMVPGTPVFTPTEADVEAVVAASSPHAKKS